MLGLISMAVYIIDLYLFRIYGWQTLLPLIYAELIIFIVLYATSTNISDQLDNTNTNEELASPDIIESLGDRMKNYEKLSQSTAQLLPYQTFSIRLDGKNFSRQTKGLKKPFDDLFSEAMCLTSVDLIKEFNAATVSTQSDEITMVFPAHCTYTQWAEQTSRSEHHFGGSVPKLLSVSAAIASTRFTCHMLNLLKKSVGDKTDTEQKLDASDVHQKYFDKLFNEDTSLNATYAFDSRITIFPESKAYEAVNNLYWRTVCDGYRNFVSMLCYDKFSKSDVHGMHTDDRVELLKTKGIDVDSFPSHYKYGWMIKNHKYEDERLCGDQKIRIVSSHDIVAVSFKLVCSEELSKKLFLKKNKKN
jgi:tRNA(His) 5'-end guanylyltransferase